MKRLIEMSGVSRMLTGLPLALLYATCWFAFLWFSDYPVEHWPMVVTLAFIAAYLSVQFVGLLVMVGLLFTVLQLRRILAELDFDSDEVDQSRDPAASRANAIGKGLLVCILLLAIGASVIILDTWIDSSDMPPLLGNLSVMAAGVSVAALSGIVSYFGWTIHVIFKGRRLLAHRSGVTVHTTIPQLNDWFEHLKRRGRVFAGLPTVVADNYLVAHRVRR